MCRCRKVNDYVPQSDIRVPFDKFVYIGDSDTDIPCMEIAEISGCPADASQEVKKIANKVCLHNGGDGAVREFIEWIIENFE